MELEVGKRYVDTYEKTKGGIVEIVDIGKYNLEYKVIKSTNKKISSYKRNCKQIFSISVFEEYFIPLENNIKKL